MHTANLVEVAADDGDRVDIFIHKYASRRPTAESLQPQLPRSGEQIQDKTTLQLKLDGAEYAFLDLFRSGAGFLSRQCFQPASSRGPCDYSQTKTSFPKHGSRALQLFISFVTGANGIGHRFFKAILLQCTHPFDGGAGRGAYLINQRAGMFSRFL